MRKNSPQNQTHKGAEKPTSPRLTLRFQSIKSKDDKNLGGSKANDVSSSQPKYQAYCVTMETRDGYEQKKDDASVSSTQNPAPSNPTGSRDNQDVVSSSSATSASASAPTSSAVPKDNNDARETLWNRTLEGDRFPSSASSAVGSSHLEKADSTDTFSGTKVSPGPSNLPKPNVTNASEATTYDYSSDTEKEENRRKRRKSSDSIGGTPKSSISGQSQRSYRNANAQSSIPTARPSPPESSGITGHPVDPKPLQLPPPLAISQTPHSAKGGSPKSAKKKSSAPNSDAESTQSDGEADKRPTPPETASSTPHATVSQVNTTVTTVAVSGSQNGSPTSGNGSPQSPKVPPLKIVIGGLGSSDVMENRERNKVSSSKTTLPYVVSTAAEDSIVNFSSGNNNPDTSSSSVTGQADDAVSSNIGSSSKDRGSEPGSASSTPSKSKEEERFQRVTRSSQRMQAALANAGTSQGDAGCPSGFSSASSSRNDHSGESSTDEHNQPVNSNSSDVQHPRKRKLRTRDGNGNPDSSQPAQPPPLQQPGGPGPSNSSSSSSSSSSISSSAEDPPQQGPQGPQPQLPQQQQLNCYQMFFNIRKQVDKRRKAMFIVHPKPPQGFKDYLLNRCSYVLEGNAASRISVPTIPPPQTLTVSMKELFILQEKERYKLRLQHLIEREKLVLSAEQEILRVHGRAARAMANQTVPLSACSILKDEEIYNSMELEQEDKDKNVRSRYNGRLFLSWLQDVDDKWEKIKEVTLLRHHNEAESLHAVQKLDWEWKMKELAMCEVKSTPVIDDIYVPMVHVSDDFDLLPT